MLCRVNESGGKGEENGQQPVTVLMVVKRAPQRVLSLFQRVLPPVSRPHTPSKWSRPSNSPAPALRSDLALQNAPCPLQSLRRDRPAPLERVDTPPPSSNLHDTKRELVTNPPP